MWRIGIEPGTFERKPSKQTTGTKLAFVSIWDYLIYLAFYSSFYQKERKQQNLCRWLGSNPKPPSMKSPALSHAETKVTMTSQRTFSFVK
jgi:hypothetical protein